MTAWLIYHVVDTDQKSVAGTTGEEDGKAVFHRCVDLFAHSAQEVLETMAGFSCTARTGEQAGEEPELYVRIDLVGQVEGTAILGFPKTLALRLVEAMTMMSLDQVDELVESALCEVTNIACGNGATALVKRGLACDIRPPVLSRRADDREKWVEVVLDTEGGPLLVGLLLKDAAQQLLP